MLLALVFTIAVAVVSSESNEVAHARFYRDFAQIYRQGKAMPSTDNPAIDFYRFEFALDEYSSITDESMTMLHADVIERTVVFHAYPNFETKGQRYFYRRDLKEDDLIEIELIEPEELLFRQVDHPERYFYLNSFEKILYKDKAPRKPFYEVLFKCNRTKSNAGDQRSPMLSYVDQAFKWTARYTLDLPKDGSKNVTKIYGYADIHNMGTRDLIFASAEVITGDVAMSDVETPFKDSRDDFPMNRLALPSGLTLTGQSVKSVPLFRDSVQVEKFFTYSSKFSLTNSTGMLTMMFNITSLNQNLPIGRLFFIRDTKFFGEMQLPSMKVGETGIFLLNEDSNATFRRRVTMIGGSLDGPSVTYRVSYDFDYGKTPRDVPLQFVETFRRYSSFQVKNLSHPGFQVTQTTVDGELLAEKDFSYEITIPKMKVQEKQKVQ